MKTRALEERFWEKVNKTETCWLWTGNRMTSGYGTIGAGGKYGKNLSAHRISYEMANGPFDKSLFVCHTCDIKLCINPSHLFLGTQTDNMRDCSKKGRMEKCYRFPKGENHPYFGKTTPDSCKKAMSIAKQRTFSCTDPSGRHIEAINLTKFCKDNSLNQGAMWSVCKGKLKYHKGYTPPKQ